MAVGRKPQLTARGIITSLFHHHHSEPGSLVIPKFIYTQNTDILRKEPELIGACTAGLNSVFVPVQVLWSTSLFATSWDSGDSAWLSVRTHTCFCDRHILPSTIYQLELWKFRIDSPELINQKKPPQKKPKPPLWVAAMEVNLSLSA